MMDNQEANADSLPEETSSGSESHKKGRINLQLDNAYDLLRLDAIKGVQDELWAWGKRRFWWVIAFGAVGGFLSLGYLVESRVESRVDKEIERYEAKFDDLRDALAESRSATKSAVSAADSLGTKLSSIDDQASKLQTQLVGVRFGQDERSQDNLKITEDIRADLEQLTSVVNKLTEELKPEDIRLLTRRIGDIETSLDQTQSAISDARLRATLGRYPIGVHGFDGARILAGQLEGQGYAVNLYLDSTFDGHEGYKAIWIGDKFPVGVATHAIAVARETWPFLEFAYLSDNKDFGNDMFIGGFTVRAKEKVRPLTQDDFRRLSDTTQTQEEFHKLLRSFELPPEQSSDKRKGGGLLNRLFNF